MSTNSVNNAANRDDVLTTGSVGSKISKVYTLLASQSEHYKNTRRAIKQAIVSTGQAVQSLVQRKQEAAKEADPGASCTLLDQQINSYVVQLSDMLQKLNSNVIAVKDLKYYHQERRFSQTTPSVSSARPKLKRQSMSDTGLSSIQLYSSTPSTLSSRVSSGEESFEHSATTSPGAFEATALTHFEFPEMSAAVAPLEGLPEESTEEENLETSRPEPTITERNIEITDTCTCSLYVTWIEDNCDVCHKMKTRSCLKSHALNYHAPIRGEAGLGPICRGDFMVMTTQSFQPRALNHFTLAPFVRVPFYLLRTNNIHQAVETSSEPNHFVKQLTVSRNGVCVMSKEKLVLQDEASAFYQSVVDEGRLLYRTVTDTEEIACYAEAGEESNNRVVVTEPRATFILRDVYCLRGQASDVFNDAFIVLRRVQQTVKLTDGTAQKNEFFEPIFARIAYLGHEDSLSTHGDYHIRLFYLTNEGEVHGIIIRHEEALEACVRAARLLNDDGPPLPLCDRKIVLKIRVVKKTHTVSELKEYQTTIPLQERVIRMTSITEQSSVYYRYKTVKSTKEPKNTKICQFEDLPGDCVRKQIKVTVPDGDHEACELITQPNISELTNNILKHDLATSVPPSFLMERRVVVEHEDGSRSDAQHLRVLVQCTVQASCQPSENVYDMKPSTNERNRYALIKGAYEVFCDDGEEKIRQDNCASPLHKYSMQKDVKDREIVRFALMNAQMGEICHSELKVGILSDQEVESCKTFGHVRSSISNDSSKRCQIQDMFNSFLNDNHSIITSSYANTATPMKQTSTLIHRIDDTIAIRVTVEQPNLVAVLNYIMSLLKKHSEETQDGPFVHETDCKYKQYGLFIIYTKRCVSIMHQAGKEVNEVDLETRTEPKLVRLMCSECDKAMRLIDSYDGFDDACCVTRSNELLSMVDLQAALRALCEETTITSDSEHHKLFLKRFRARIQRLMGPVKLRYS